MNRIVSRVLLIAFLTLAACSVTNHRHQRATSTATAPNKAQDTLIGSYEFATGSEPHDIYIAVTVSPSSDSYIISFQGAHPDAHGAAPEGEGTGRIHADGTLRFTYKDSFFNRGTGTFRRGARGYDLSITISDVADPRCMRFYGDFTLERIKPKTRNA